MANAGEWTEAHRVEQVEGKYFAGEELFTRDLLTKILDVRKRRDSSVELPDYVNGTNRLYRLDLDLGYEDGQ